jgi:dnd system-associated protein 4
MIDMSRGSIRVSIDSTLHELYKELSEGSDPEKVPFRTMKDIFMLAVCLGYRRGQRKPIIGSKRQIFHWAQFSDHFDIPILKSISISTTNGIQVLSEPERIVEIAEEYANIGIQEINSHYINNGSYNLWNLVGTIRL